VQQLLGLIDRTTLADNGAYWVRVLVCCAWQHACRVVRAVFAHVPAETSAHKPCARACRRGMAKQYPGRMTAQWIRAEWHAERTTPPQVVLPCFLNCCLGALQRLVAAVYCAVDLRPAPGRQAILSYFRVVGGSDCVDVLEVSSRTHSSVLVKRSTC
jgi:hypothetical protein